MHKILIFLEIIVSSNLFAQSAQDIPIGTWRSHSSTDYFNNIMTTDDGVYASSNETFVKYDFEDNSITKLSKSFGYSDVGISELRYYKERNLYMVGYENGNIDIVSGNMVYNLSDIKRKPILGSKAINHITFKNSNAYLSTDFGIVILDLDKKEIKDAGMNIGPAGKSLKVLCSDIKEDTIYIVSDQGIFYASLKTNLLNFGNWKKFRPSESKIPTGNISGIAVLDKEVFAIVSTYYIGNQVLVNHDSAGLYKLNGQQWTKLFKFNDPVHSINNSNNRLVIASEQNIYLYSDKMDSVRFEHFVTDAMYDKFGNIWASTKFGGVKSNKGGTVGHYNSNGPYISNSFKLGYGNGKIYNYFGGFFSNTTNYGSSNGFDIYDDNTWKNYSEAKGSFKGLDFIDGVYNPETGIQYIASYGFGLYAFKNNILTNRYTDSNSTLVRVVPNGNYLRVCALAVDSSGYLWAVNATPSVTSPLFHSLSPEGKWKGYPISAPVFLPLELDIDQKKNKWLRVKGSRQTLLVFNENNKDLYRIFDLGAGKGGLPGGVVMSVAVDKKGEVWVGTDKGIAVLKEGSDPYKSDFTLPYFDGFPLLMDKEVFSIDVDAGNRKWVGTKNGLWLFNEDATRVISFFDEDNSPLPSSEIKDVEINHVSGEVFINTAKGLVSYRGMASEGIADKFNNVKVFPNPVKPNFNGNIGITGLAADANVKITDIYGNLVYETQAQGGMAIWNGKNYNGVKATSGIYLILSATTEGEEGFVGKISIIE